MISSASRRRLGVSSLAVLAALGAAAAHAAEAPNAAAAGAALASGPSTLSELVVTASRRESTALTTPINISAVTGADLVRQGVQDFRDLTRTVPGLVYNSNSIRNGGATNSFVLHGLNLDDVSNSGDQPLPTVPPVSVYLNETPSFVNLHLADVERVEVLRGPQATLYGDASIAGTVRVLFNQPDLTRSSMELSGQTSWTRHADGPNGGFDAVFNKPIGDELGFRIAGGYTFEHGFINAPHMMRLDANGAPVLADPSDPVHSLPVPTSAKQVDNADLWYVRPVLLFRHEQWKVLVTYQHQHEHADGADEDSYPGGSPPTSYSSALTPGFQNDNFDAAFPPVFGKYESGQFIMQPYSRDVDVASVEASYDLGFATLTSVTSGYNNESKAITDNSGFYQASLGFLYSGYPRLLLASHRDYRDFAGIEEVRLVSSGAGPLTWTVGAFYMHQHNHLLQDDMIPGFADYSAALGAPTGTDLAYQYERFIHFIDRAVFGEASWHITPKWQVTGGVRVLRQTLDLSSTIELAICGAFCSNDGVNPLGLSGGGDRQVVTKALFKGNTSYQFNKDLLGFFTFSQGERRGGANGVPTKGLLGESPAFLFFQPDTVNNYEVGLKGRIGGVFEFSGALYYIDWENPQVNVSTPVGAFPAAVNGKKATSKGVDLDARWRVAQGVTLSGTYSYNKAELKDPIEVGGKSFGAAGSRLPGTPNHTASFAVDYDRPVGDMSLDAHADVSWRSDMTTSLTPSLNVNLPGFAVLNASVGVARDAWRVALFADNLTNSRGVISAHTAEAYDARGVDNRVMRPLTVGVRFGYKTP
jgi:outer membrane receptor protein involved in Fe transport